MRKLVSVILSTSMLWAPTAAFADGLVMSPWAEPEVREAQMIGIVDETLPADYTGAVNRWNFCVMAYKTIKDFLDTEDNATPFTDTDDARITSLYNAGIVTGKNNAEFKPFDKLTREEAAAVMTRIINYLEIPVNAISFIYDDLEDVSPWARPYIDTVSAVGLMNGYENEFMPLKQYTIEQSIATVLRLYHMLPEIENTAAE